MPSRFAEEFGDGFHTFEILVEDARDGIQFPGLRVYTERNSILDSIVLFEKIGLIELIHRRAPSIRFNMIHSAVRDRIRFTVLLKRELGLRAPGRRKSEAQEDPEHGKAKKRLYCRDHNRS